MYRNRLHQAAATKHRCCNDLCLYHHVEPFPRQCSDRQCSEPPDTITDLVRPCRTCPNAICVLCLNKLSRPNFNEDVFQARRRLFCTTCWNANLSPSEREAARYLRQVYSGQYVDVPSSVIPVYSLGDDRNEILLRFCHCDRGRDSTLCHDCQTPPLRRVQLVEPRCINPGCFILLTANNYGGSRCRWCDLPCGPASRVERREIFHERKDDFVDLFKAAKMDQHLPKTPLAWEDMLNVIEGDTEQCDMHAVRASLQIRFDRASDEKVVEAQFGKYNYLEEMVRDRMRWRLYDIASPVSLNVVASHGKRVKSLPLVTEGRVPDSLPLFKPLVIDKQEGRIYEGTWGMEDFDRNDQGDEDTLCDGNSNAGTSKMATRVGKGKIADVNGDDDDVRTISSTVSTLYERAETGLGMVNENVESVLMTPPHRPLVSTKAEREWANFCTDGFSRSKYALCGASGGCVCYDSHLY